jgi:hypothetical protein
MDIAGINAARNREAPPALRRAECDRHKWRRDEKGLTDSVGEQTAVSDKIREPIDRRYVVSGRRRYDRRAMRGHECIRIDDKPASRLVSKGRDGRFDFYVAMNGRSDWHDLERPIRTGCRD